MFRRTCFAWLLAALLPGTLLAKEEPAAVLVDAAFKPAEQAGKLLAVTEAQALKGVKRVVVPLFSVEFVTADSMRAETSGFGAAGRASAAAYYKLTGVGEAEFQAMTEALYAGFVRELQAAGLEVLPQAQLAASPIYRKLAASGSAAPIRNDASLVMAPAGMAIYGLNKAQATGGGGGLFSALSAMGNVASAMGAVMDTAELHKELGAAVLEVQMRVHFVQLTNNNKGFLGRMAGSASVGAQVFPRIAMATLSVHRDTRGTLSLTGPLALDPAAFTEVRKAPTTAGDVAAGVATALIRLASNSRDSSSSEELLAVADPARYRDIVGAGLAGVNEMFITRLRAGE